MFKPLLAAKMPKDKTVEEVVRELEYPIMASPKLDGIRVIIKDGEVLTRKLKLVPNNYIRESLSTRNYEGLDGELTVGLPTDPNLFRLTTSAVMSREGEPKFCFRVFDNPIDKGGFINRYNSLKKRVEDLPHVKIVEHEIIENGEDLLDYEHEALSDGYEGVMVRSLGGLYKYGRSTWREGILRKITRTIREEAIIVGYEERLHNSNEAKRDELGRIKRSSHKENMVKRGDLGALIVRSDNYDKPFSIGTGFSDEERAKLWALKKKLMGKIITFEYRNYGNYDAPRFAVFKGFRNPIDIS